MDIVKKVYYNPSTGFQMRKDCTKQSRIKELLKIKLMNLSEVRKFFNFTKEQNYRNIIFQ